MPRPTHSTELVDKKKIGQSSWQLTFRLSSDSGFSFSAGQFVQFLLLVDEKELKRSYSIANSPESYTTTGCLEIAVSYIEGGVASCLFAAAEVGAEFNMSGPFGVLTAPEQHENNLVLIGTGTGIAPYRSMIPELQKLSDEGVSVRILMGARYRQDVIYAEDFRRLVRTASNLDYRVCLSREPSVDVKKGEYSGYVQEQLEANTLDPDKDLVYLCGNPLMIDDLLVILKQYGFSRRRIRREKYVFSGH